MLGGPNVPGIGFGMGLERVQMALDEEGIAPPDGPRLDCFVVALGEAARVRAGEVLRALRQAGINCMTEFEPKPLGAQMRGADRHGARYAVVRVTGTCRLRPADKVNPNLATG